MSLVASSVGLRPRLVSLGTYELCSILDFHRLENVVVIQCLMSMDLVEYFNGTKLGRALNQKHSQAY